MVVGWILIGLIGAATGHIAEGRTAEDELSAGFVFGYVTGVATACAGMKLIVSMLPDNSNSYERAVANEEQAYIQWRKRHGAKPAKAKLADEDEEDSVVDLKPADAAPPPREVRMWKRRDWEGE